MKTTRRITRPILVFLLLSLVSFFADFTYEGARSISGPYLSELGASLVIAGSISIGETLSYLGRLLSGLLTYRYATPRFYWGMVFIGYSINLIAVPLLAFAGEWRMAFILYLIERIGKGLRVPVRDAILSEVGASLGPGKLFGIHELLDQAGAIVGALFISWSIGALGVSSGLLLLSIPAAAAITLLTASYTLHPRPKVAAKPARSIKPIMRDALRISLPVGLPMLIYVHWATAGFLLSREISIETIAALYSVVMLVDGIVALPLGALYDRVGKTSLALLPILSALGTLSLFYSSPLIFAVLWGTAMATYETIAKAYVAASTKREERGITFGIVYAIMGFSWTIGNIALALLLS